MASNSLPAPAHFFLPALSLSLSALSAPSLFLANLSPRPFSPRPLPAPSLRPLFLVNFLLLPHSPPQPHHKASMRTSMKTRRPCSLMKDVLRLNSPCIQHTHTHTHTRTHTHTHTTVAPIKDSLLKPVRGTLSREESISVVLTHFFAGTPFCFLLKSSAQACTRAMRSAHKSKNTTKCRLSGVHCVN